jgi:uncharacterized NAD(P)/FAD-binding protein YdhS
VGIDWRSVVDALRPLTPEIWRSLPGVERKRFVRHLRPYRDVHRHRVAPDVSEQLTRLIGEEQIQIHAGRLSDYRKDENQVVVTFRRRRDGRAEKLHVSRVINCTGPEADWRRIDNSLFSSLFARRLARPDSLFLGLDTDRNGSVLNWRGAALKSLVTIGPLRKGGLWETTAVPELRQRAYGLAEHIMRVISEEGCAEQQPTDSLSR